ncbi:MAG: Plug domain-containing protein [Gemmatimonadetes bacterium]|nr:Plug domain-containing protein [Gemmatimonadota bacterium]MCY3611781.1 Plug domain-containing protein [Gemmatimonadota bacterium]MCY3677116.1 Plug domain-containing protein [Gemmatimonadota bacterium]MYA40634.1 Plug domain-containing protein [Gemmatimonadota bacterium]MYE93705.1 Plug domain-containing protein [Gemmatimonadota bacterium]
MRLNRSHMTLSFIIAFGLATAVAACSSTGGPSGPRRDPNLITAEELSEYATLSALDVVRRLRPRWLTGRGQGSGGMNRPQVLQDGTRLGDPDNALRSIAVSDIESIRYLSASDATMRYGTNFPGGAIVVTSRAR